MKRNRINLLCLVTLCLVGIFWGSGCLAEKEKPKVKKGETLSGQVTRVYDGDTIDLLVEQTEPKNGQKVGQKTVYRVRFQAVDAPERFQDYGEASRKHLHAMIYGKTVQATIDKIDQHGRVVARIRMGKTDVEQKMLEAGMVWHYTHFNQEKNLAAAQETAQKAQIGIWSKPNPTPPWEWRQQQRTKKRKP